MKKSFLLNLIAVLSVFYVFPQEAKEQKMLQFTTFKTSIENNKIQLIDVRTPKEFAAGTIEYAQNIDFLNPAFKDNIQQLDKNAPIYIFCQSGKRSDAAAQELIDLGFKEVYELAGGYKNWSMSEFGLLTKKDFKHSIEESKVQLIDVRTADEFEAGTIDYAQNIDFLNIDFKKNIQYLNKDEPVYIFCQSGKRSAAARKVMLELGFKNVQELEGGYNAWL